MVIATRNQLYIFDALPEIERIERDGYDIWETCVESGIEAMRVIDNGKWMVGDIAHAITRKYGERSPRGESVIEKFAYAINADSKRVMEYRTVSKFWTPEHRKSLIECPVLSYTHFRDSMRLGDVKTAKAFLAKCADKNLTITQARIEIATRLGKKPTHMRVGTVNATVVEQTGTLVLIQVENDYNTPIPRLEVGKSYQMSIYETLED